MYLNTPTIYSTSPPSVDRATGIISNVQIAKVGSAKGHNVNLNQNFINDVVLKGNAHKPGLKARFGHPNICATALGSYLGRFKNFRENNGTAFADMHLDKLAIKSPNGDLYNYVLDMAENNPDMFGASIAFKQGKELKIKDSKGKFQTFASIDSLYAADFVDSPAATDGLFELFHQDDLASQVTLFLDDHPQVFQILLNKPAVLDEFLAKYKSYKNNYTMNFSDHFNKVKTWVNDQFASFFEDNSPDTPKDVISSLSDDFKSQLDSLNVSFTDQLQISTDRIAELETENTSLLSDLNSLKATKTALASGDPALKLVRNKPKSFSILTDAPKDFKRKVKNQLPKS